MNYMFRCYELLVVYPVPVRPGYRDSSRGNPPTAVAAETSL